MSFVSDDNQENHSAVCGNTLINNCSDLNNTIDLLKNKLFILEENQAVSERKYQAVINSFSWKITSPLRSIGSLCKKVFRFFIRAIKLFKRKWNFIVRER